MRAPEIVKDIVAGIPMGLFIIAFIFTLFIGDDNNLDSNWDYLGLVDAIEFHGEMSVYGDTMTIYTNKEYIIKVVGNTISKHGLYRVYMNKSSCKLKLVSCTWCKKPVYIFTVIDNSIGD